MTVITGLFALGRPTITKDLSNMKSKRSHDCVIPLNGWVVVFSLSPQMLWEVLLFIGRKAGLRSSGQSVKTGRTGFCFMAAANDKVAATAHKTLPQDQLFYPVPTGLDKVCADWIDSASQEHGLDIRTIARLQHEHSRKDGEGGSFQVPDDPKNLKLQRTICGLRGETQIEQALMKSGRRGCMRCSDAYLQKSHDLDACLSTILCPQKSPPTPRRESKGGVSEAADACGGVCVDKHWGLAQWDYL
ncbi:hypothetical protein OPV22_008474 [Ensete ventricosum]|uniref:Uncharacterized protein n=1 Tax=Ensete ventricosum TaxID=4639 RepID=A0AAV8RCB5_ENSVE|nr:hypothetical protein OPV22_008474 [Ensete ventricosum]